MKYRSFLFLDIDGVMNPLNDKTADRTKLIGKNKTKYIEFPNNALEYLGWIVRSNRCYIVLSSTWKLNEDTLKNVKKELARYGMKLYGQTPTVISENKRVRGLEIKKYLEDYASEYGIDIEDIPYVIIDDECSDILPYHDKSYVIKCNMKKGLRMREARMAFMSIGVRKVILDNRRKKKNKKNGEK